jgi:hypothetical protein
MKVRIQADGSVAGTKILTEDGTDISNAVEAVRFHHRGGDVPRAEIDIIFAVGAALADATLYHAAPGRERKAIKRIEYADGTVFESGADESACREADDGA